MTGRQALARRFMEKALSGDPRVFALLLKLDGASNGSTSDASLSESNQVLSPDEMAMLQGFLQSVTPAGETKQ